jgi:hypothetical protein
LIAALIQAGHSERHRKHQPIQSNANFHIPKTSGWQD